MSILSIKDVNFIKLKSLKKEYLNDLCKKFSVSTSTNIQEMIKNILTATDDGRLTTDKINDYIKNIYTDIRRKEIEKTGADHQSIINELNKVDSHIWGMVQGKADAYIQSNYVRKYFKFNDLINAVRGSLFGAMEAYTLCTWYNHWSTVFLEDLICQNNKVIPIIKKIKGVDIIWNEQAVDIKVTNLPKEWFRDGHSINDAINNPIQACEYLYTYQGAERFGAENRFFIIVHDKRNPENSWKIKREYLLIKKTIDSFFSQDLQLDPVSFSFGEKKTPHLSHAKMMFIIK